MNKSFLVLFFKKEQLPSSLALLFLIYAALAVSVMAVLVPPFCNADEAAHFLRADQVAGGGFIALWPGGIVDAGIDTLSSRFEAVRGHAEVKADQAVLQGAWRIGWGERNFAGFPNTAPYPPTAYLPAAAAIWAGRHLGWPVAVTLVGARLANGAVCIGICACAIALSGEIAALLFTLLCLPMSLCLFATVSQDGVLIAASAMAVALARRGARGWTLGLLAACLAVSAMGRPPYLAMAVIVLTLGAWRWRARVAVFCAIIAAVGAWSVWCAAPVLAATGRPAGVDAAGQIAFVLAHPARFWQVPYLVLVRQLAGGLPYAREFVGVLGWLDVPLPGMYYYAAWAAIGLALLAAHARAHAAVLAAGMLAGAGIFAVQYLTWTAVGSMLVEGVQGRYFLPVALFAPLMVGGPGVRSRWIYAGLAAFPAVGIGVAVRAVMLRYYLS